VAIIEVNVVGLETFEAVVDSRSNIVRLVAGTDTSFAVEKSAELGG
jgi:hypothetical protein